MALEKRRRKITPEGRRRISAAMKARWAKVKAPTSPAVNGHHPPDAFDKLMALYNITMKRERDLLNGLIELMETAIAHGDDIKPAEVLAVLQTRWSDPSST
jgi:hypothetical protein